MKEEPFDGPRDYAIHKRFVWIPCILHRVVNAKFGKSIRIAVSIDMLWRLSSAARIVTDRWINHEYANVVVLQAPTFEKPSREVQDANAVPLADWSHHSFPNTDPAGVRNKAKLRAFSPQSLILLFHTERRHRV